MTYELRSAQILNIAKSEKKTSLAVRLVITDGHFDLQAEEHIGKHEPLSVKLDKTSSQTGTYMPSYQLVGSTHVMRLTIT